MGKNLTKKLVGTAVFSALAYVVSFLEFPIFPAAPFLKLDFSAVFILLAGFAFGAVYGVSAVAVKELLCYLTKSSTGGVGEIANAVMIIAFIIVPTVVYQYRKGFLTVIITLLIGCVLEVGASLLVNRFITFPLFMGGGALQAFSELWVFVMCFNIIKSVVLCVVTILLYKSVSKIIKKI